MKKCFKCSLEKSLEDFYKHKKMADGRLNKCKNCCKLDEKKRIEKLSKNTDWIEKERKRGRDKYYRLNYAKSKKPAAEKKKILIINYKKSYPEKTKAKNKTSHLKALVKGNQLHHWSYNEEHYKDVIELDKKDHYLLHRFLIYDNERFMYRRIDNLELLDTKESHIFYLQELKNKF